MDKTLEMRVEELEQMLFLTKNVLSFDEASKFLNLSKSYLYKLTSGNLIPHYKPHGKSSVSCPLKPSDSAPL
ncbi:DNA-binding protein, partial [Bacteroides sp. AM16-24]|uniref:helix-turn-helix domain-containing protein n=1 Tax=Bacteroides sp. AM16-24 TaxID=2292002 RepID=UPI000FF5F72B